MADARKLDFTKLHFADDYPDLDQVSAAIEKLGTMAEISEVNWQSYRYKPEVHLFGGYTEHEILLKYRVTENHILARHVGINAPVHTDSCVEFFISSGNGHYYNLEFNCIGTPYVGYGTQRSGRTLVDEHTVSTIRTLSTLGNRRIDLKEIDDHWELTIAVPFSLFKESEHRDPYNRTFKANFYKCGDDLPLPHYLSLNPINTRDPDFHRPEFFGTLNLI